jgi:Lrp/AsnC family leucine-responsive transcriptional regulator
MGFRTLTPPAHVAEDCSSEIGYVERMFRMDPELDDIDLRILRELRWKARMPNRELAERVGLSPSPCWTRLRRLESSGVIESYVAVYNPTALGTPDTVIIYITLERHDDEQLARFEAALADLPEVIEAYLLTGDFDYFIKVAVAGTSGLRALPAREAVPDPRHPAHAEQFHAAVPEADLLGRARARALSGRGSGGAAVTTRRWR